MAGSAGSLALLGRPELSLAAECLSSYVPATLTVDCASRHNFKTFRQYPKHVGLAGVVSMTNVTGKFGRYNAGNLFLFPWLKPGGAALGLSALFPTSPTASRQALPLARASVADELFCGTVIQAPRPAFIGFIVNVPYDEARTKTKRCTNYLLNDGKQAGINWTSSNLNHPYFAGSRLIPSTSLCNGSRWRALIVEGLKAASTGAC
jgi:hypothetical protein